MTTELAGEGTDLVNTTITWTLAANVENLTLTGTTAINGTGNTLANAIVGNSGANVLSGSAGADTLTGNGGDDRLDGGADNDTLSDNSGANIYIAGAGNDTLNVTSTGIDRIAVARGHGSDTLVSSGTAANDVLEVSNGILKSQMGLMKTGNDLIVDLGSGEALTLRNWYASVRNVGTLKIIGDAGWVPGQSGTPAIVETLSLVTLAAEFDAARVADPTLTRWAIDPAQRMSAEAFLPLEAQNQAMPARLSGPVGRSTSKFAGLPRFGALDLRRMEPTDVLPEPGRRDLNVGSIPRNMRAFLKFWESEVPSAEAPSTLDWLREMIAQPADGSPAVESGSDFTAEPMEASTPAADPIANAPTTELQWFGNTDAAECLPAGEEPAPDDTLDRAGELASITLHTRTGAVADDSSEQIALNASALPNVRTAPWWEEWTALEPAAIASAPSADSISVNRWDLLLPALHSMPAKVPPLEIGIELGSALPSIAGLAPSIASLELPFANPTGLPPNAVRPALQTSPP